MSERKLFNFPIRKGITDEFYPDKITLEQFKKVIVYPFDAYATNMKHLGGDAIKDKYIEDWVGQYLDWLDIEQEK